MKKKPAILFLLPSATASGLAVSTLSGYGTAWPSNSSPGAKGLQTGSRTFVVGDGSSFSAEAVYYDWRSQPVQKHSIDHRGTREDLFLNLSFTGKTVASRKVVTPSGGAATVVTREMSYDGWDRLAGEVTTVSGGGADATDRVTYSYDDVGRMTGRTYGEPGSAGSTAETLSYNARGWLTGQASPVYSSTLRYTDPSRTSTAGRYGGSISEWSWSRGSGSGMQTYAFSYDGLDRLTGSKRYIGSSTVATDAFTEQGLEYDRNGNIKALVRYGQSAADPEDDLLFTLSGNRIWTISNSGSNGSGKTYSAFAYDANGNTTHDGRTGQDLVWNALNLLSGATVTEGGATSTLATYTWLADGTKYSTERPDGSGYVYKGELIYTKAPGGALTLDCVLTTGGRIVAERDADGTLSGYSVRHHIRDHLGSVRAVTDGSTGEVLETSDYLPFGTRWALTGGTQGATATLTDPSNRWRYSGKEEQQALSPALFLLDYGARMYDPTLARWLTPDPLAEKYMQWSPYGYCIGNPINLIDKDGNDVVYITFPDYKANGIPFTGHAGVLLINNKTGLTKYYEFGRYNGNLKGVVRKPYLSDVIIGEDGKPTIESLKRVLKEISNKSGNHGDIEGAYIISNQFKEMNDYAIQKMAESKDPNSKRKGYSFISNNCATFAMDVITQDKSIHMPSIILINSPFVIVRRIQKKVIRLFDMMQKRKH